MTDDERIRILELEVGLLRWLVRVTMIQALPHEDVRGILSALDVPPFGQPLTPFETRAVLEMREKFVTDTLALLPQPKDGR